MLVSLGRVDLCVDGVKLLEEPAILCIQGIKTGS